MRSDAVRVRVQAPPAQETANQALVQLSVEQLEGSCCEVEVVSGHSSGWNRVRVDGVNADSIEALLLPTG